MGNRTKDILKQWPSYRILAEDIGTKRRTVEGWAARGRIPAKWMPLLLKSANKFRIRLTAAQLIDLTDD